MISISCEIIFGGSKPSGVTRIYAIDPELSAAVGTSKVAGKSCPLSSVRI